MASPMHLSTLFNAASSAKQTIAQCLAMNSPPAVLVICAAAYADSVVALVRIVSNPGQHKTVMNHVLTSLKNLEIIAGRGIKDPPPHSFHELDAFAKHQAAPVFGVSDIPPAMVPLAPSQIRTHAPPRDEPMLHLGNGHEADAARAPIFIPKKPRKAAKKPPKSATIIQDSDDEQGSPAAGKSGSRSKRRRTEVEVKPIDAAMLSHMKINKTTPPYSSGIVMFLPYHCVPGINIHSTNYIRAIQTISKSNANVTVFTKKIRSNTHAEAAVVDSESEGEATVTLPDKSNSDALIQRARAEAVKRSSSRSTDESLIQRRIDLVHERDLASSRLLVTMESMDRFDEETTRINTELARRTAKAASKDKGKGKAASAVSHRGCSPVKGSQSVDSAEESSSPDIDMEGSADETRLAQGVTVF